MTALVISPSAREDISRATEWYESQRPGLGEAFLDRVDDAINSAASQPDLYQEVVPGVRRVLVRKFPYSVYYTVDLVGVVILAIVHQSMHESEWRRRVR